MTLERVTIMRSLHWLLLDYLSCSSVLTKMEQVLVAVSKTCIPLHVSAYPTYSWSDGYRHTLGSLKKSPSYDSFSYLLPLLETLACRPVVG
jgi:hypothetical protein